jgi:hypothetical protein
MIVGVRATRSGFGGYAGLPGTARKSTFQNGGVPNSSAVSSGFDKDAGVRKQTVVRLD